VLAELLTALQNLEPVAALRASRWVYPLVNAGHIAGIALLVGAILPRDLRLLGAWRSVPLDLLSRVLLPVAIAQGGIPISVRARAEVSQPGPLSGGNTDVILCERGIRTFETATRNTLDVSAIPIVKELSHLPIFVDPSHGTGHTYLVPQMAAASIAAGADVLILEVHPEPETALSDVYQSLNFDQFEETMQLCRKVAAAMGREI